MIVLATNKFHQKKFIERNTLLLPKPTQGVGGQFGLRGWSEARVCVHGLLQRPEDGAQTYQRRLNQPQ